MKERSKLTKKVIPLLLLAYSNAYATGAAYNDNESDVQAEDIATTTENDYFENDASVLVNEEVIKELKNSYISPYNYLQDPIALDMGLSQQAESTGTFHLGTSIIANMNRDPQNGQYTVYNTDIFQIWGQTNRYAGFALGAGGTGVLFYKQTGEPTDASSMSVFALNQAYIDYQYKNKFNVTAGNILLSTPWVNSFGSNPGATYAMGNNTFQGAVFNIQASPSILITGFNAWTYLQYPNNSFNQQTYYNTNDPELFGVNNTTTNGPAGLGITWNPIDSYTAQLWLYNFTDYAKMAYLENSYHLTLNDLFSFDFGWQGFSQYSSGTALTNQSTQSTAPQGLIASNGVGSKIALNIGKNTTSISYNNIFGSNNSYLNGGMVTPYSYGMETDPLYTTPALTSLAEQGSGFAYTIRNSTSFMDNNLKYNLSMSQFYINQVYAGQNSIISEYDAAILYRIPHTNMNIWNRLVYVDNPTNGNRIQPRVIFNWVY